MPHILDIEKIPFTQLATLNLGKSDFLALPSIILSALLSGKRTPLLIFSQVALNNGLIVRDLAARISLSDTGAESYSIQIHTRVTNMPTIVQGVKLSDKQITSLLGPDNPILSLKPVGQEVQGHCLVQYDKALNDLHVRPTEPAPESINDYQLTEEQKKKFSLGAAITIPAGTIKRDFNSPLGYKADFLVLPKSSQPASPAALLDALAITYISIQSLYKSMLPPAGLRPGDIGYPPVITAPDKGFLLDYTCNALRTIERILADPAGLSEAKQIEINQYRERISALKIPSGFN